MTIPAVLLDANVLFTFALRDTILMAAEEALCLVYWSARILEETRVALIRNGIMPEERATYLIRAMQDAFPETLVEGYEYQIGRVRNHPDDRHVAAAALHAGVDAIVTFNLRHFPEDALAPHGLHALHPDSFLLDLLMNNREAMIALLERQAAGRRRPARTAIQILDGMSTLAPHYAAAVRALVLDRQGA